MFLTPHGTRETATQAAEDFHPPWDSALLRNALAALQPGQALKVKDGIVVRLTDDHIPTYEEPRGQQIHVARK